MVLFISAAALSELVQAAAADAMDVSYFDIVCYALSKDRLETLRSVPALEGVEEAVWRGESSGGYFTVLPGEQLDATFMFPSPIWRTASWNPT